MYRFWYDYVKPQYSKKVKLCYMNTDSFVVYMKTDDVYKNVWEDVGTRFGATNYELDKLLPEGKIRNKEK